MSAAWMVFLLYVLEASVFIGAAIGYAVVVTRRGRVESHVEVAQRWTVERWAFGRSGDDL